MCSHVDDMNLKFWIIYIATLTEGSPTSTTGYRGISDQYHWLQARTTHQQHTLRPTTG
jgi:hypothetical protein